MEQKFFVSIVYCVYMYYINMYISSYIHKHKWRVSTTLVFVRSCCCCCTFLWKSKIDQYSTLAHIINIQKNLPFALHKYWFGLLCGNVSVMIVSVWFFHPKNNITCIKYNQFYFLLIPILDFIILHHPNRKYLSFFRTFFSQQEQQQQQQSEFSFAIFLHLMQFFFSMQNKKSFLCSVFFFIFLHWKT